MKLTWLKVYLTLTMATMALAACHPSPRDLTVVTGKTVYGDLALEGVLMDIHKWEEYGWDHLGETRSGYHGSFRIHLAPGQYMITATTTIREGKRKVILAGDLTTLTVEEGVRRKDRVIIKMHKSK